MVCVLVGGLAALGASAALADPPGRVGRVAETEGTVWVADDERGEWANAVRNSPLTSNDRMSLPSGSRAVVQIGSATLRLDGDTEIEVLQLDDRRVRVQLHGGSAALQLPMQDSAREFELVTPEGRFMPNQRGHYRVDRVDGKSVATVWDGSLRFESNDSQLDVNQGQRVDFWQEGGRTHYASASMDRDAFTDWVVASERRDGSLARRHVSPEMTGARDLDRYGTWDNHPQYGAVWYPQSVASDWAPYRYGHWAHVRPWGWTWVDDAPWGFAPFHYGRWVNWRGRWAWTPGTYEARPTYAPALVTWFGGSNLSVSVTLGGGSPHLGWVALAPFEVFAPWYVASHLHLNTINVNPWRHVHGYREHRHHDYANRRVLGAVVVVPQAVVLERRPIRQDVITPAQASIWRGGERPPVNGIGIKVPMPSQASGGKTVDRVEVFVPPAPAVKTVAIAPPAKAPGSGRDVPWVQSSRGAAPGVPAPAVRGAPGQVEPVAPMVRTMPPGDKTVRVAPVAGEPPQAPSRSTMPPSRSTLPPPQGRSAPPVAPPSQAQNLPAPVTRAPVENRPPEARMPQPHQAPPVRSQPRQEGQLEPRRPDGRVDIGDIDRGHRTAPPPAPRAPVQQTMPAPQVHAPAPVQQVQVQRAPQPREPQPQVMHAASCTTAAGGAAAFTSASASGAG